MAFSISDTFDNKGFLVDEIRITKLADLMKKRFPEPDKAIVRYFVRRKDAATFDTRNVAEIFSESNYGSILITNLAMRILDLGNSGFTVAITFSQILRPITLEVEGPDRELVSLIAGDIKEYIHSEVITKPFHTRWLFIPVLVIGEYLALAIMRYWQAHWRELPGAKGLGIADALKSSDLAVKLDYLIQRDQYTGFDISFIVTATLLAVATLFLSGHLFVFNPQWNIVAPSNMFLIGKETTRYERLIKVRDHLFWGVIIAAVVCLITGFAVWLLTKT